MSLASPKGNRSEAGAFPQQQQEGSRSNSQNEDGFQDFSKMNVDISKYDNVPLEDLHLDVRPRIKNIIEELYSEHDWAWPPAPAKDIRKQRFFKRKKSKMLYNQECMDFTTILSIIIGPLELYISIIFAITPKTFVLAMRECVEITSLIIVVFFVQGLYHSYAGILGLALRASRPFEIGYVYPHWAFEVALPLLGIFCVCASTYMTQYWMVENEMILHLKGYNFHWYSKTMWDTYQRFMKCCGIDGYNDWKYHGPLIYDEKSERTLGVPESCCKVQNCSSSPTPETTFDGCMYKTMLIFWALYFVGAICVILSVILLCLGHRSLNEASRYSGDPIHKLLFDDRWSKKRLHNRSNRREELFTLLNNYCLILGKEMGFDDEVLSAALEESERRSLEQTEHGGDQEKDRYEVPDTMTGNSPPTPGSVSDFLNDLYLPRQQLNPNDNVGGKNNSNNPAHTREAAAAAFGLANQNNRFSVGGVGSKMGQERPPLNMRNNQDYFTVLSSLVETKTNNMKEIFKAVDEEAQLDLKLNNDSKSVNEIPKVQTLLSSMSPYGRGVDDIAKGQRYVNAESVLKLESSVPLGKAQDVIEASDTLENENLRLKNVAELMKKYSLSSSSSIVGSEDAALSSEFQRESLKHFWSAEPTAAGLPSHLMVAPEAEEINKPSEPEASIILASSRGPPADNAPKDVFSQPQSLESITPTLALNLPEVSKLSAPEFSLPKLTIPEMYCHETPNTDLELPQQQSSSSSRQEELSSSSSSPPGNQIYTDDLPQLSKDSLGNQVLSIVSLDKYYSPLNEIAFLGSSMKKESRFLESGQTAANAGEAKQQQQQESSSPPESPSFQPEEELGATVLNPSSDGAVSLLNYYRADSDSSTSLSPIALDSLRPAPNNPTLDALLPEQFKKESKKGLLRKIPTPRTPTEFLQTPAVQTVPTPPSAVSPPHPDPPMMIVSQKSGSREKALGYSTRHTDGVLRTARHHPTASEAFKQLVSVLNRSSSLEKLHNNKQEDSAAEKTKWVKEKKSHEFEELPSSYSERKRSGSGGGGGGGGRKSGIPTTGTASPGSPKSPNKQTIPLITKIHFPKRVVDSVITSPTMDSSSSSSAASPSSLGSPELLPPPVVGAGGRYSKLPKRSKPLKK